MSKETEKKKKIAKVWTIWNTIEAILLIASGVLSIVAGALHKPGEQGAAQQLEQMLAYFVAGFVILDGVLRVILYLARFKKNDDRAPFVTSGFEIAAGTLIILMQVKYNDFFVYGIVNFVAVLLMVMGLLLLVFAIYVLVKKYEKLTMPVLEILLAAILIGVGVAIEIMYNTSDSREKLVLIMAGAILLVAGLAMLIFTMVVSKKDKKQTKQFEDEEKGTYQIVDAQEQPVKKAEVVDSIEQEGPIDAIENEKPKQIENKGE